MVGAGTRRGTRGRIVVGMLAVSSLGVCASLGCAAAGPRPVDEPSAHASRERADGGVARATELYLVGESMFAEGRHAEAVAVWRHALLSLPREPRYDAVRHQLVLRMGHGLGVAFMSSQDAALLDAAEAMLERYLVVHAELFGETESARIEREQVYELLGDIAVARTVPTPSPGPEAVKRGSIDATSRSIDDHAGEVLDGEVTRKVVVDGDVRPTVDDPVERARLKSPFGDAQAAGVLTFPNDFVLHPERPLVRVRRWPRLVDSEGGDRAKLGPWLAVVRAARPQLEDCYSSAFARHPADLVDLTIEVTIARDAQRRRPSIVSGKLVDALGDACVLDALALAPSEELAAVAEDDRSRVRIELRFFRQPQAIGDGITGQSPSPVGGAVVDKAEYRMPSG